MGLRRVTPPPWGRLGRGYSLAAESFRRRKRISTCSENADAKDILRHRVCVGEAFARRVPDSQNPFPAEVAVARFVTDDVMNVTVHFDAELSLMTIEVERVLAERHFPLEVEANSMSPNLVPKSSLRL